jgi:Rrf2 family iron-sulfur cluster assembly transcriptional regulator
MKIPTMLRYGVRMVVTLAQKGEVMSTAGLAKEMVVSPLYLRQLAPVLERAGIIEGFRGARGGYRLKVRPGDITLFEIIQAFDEDFSLLDCIKSTDSCPRSADCTTRYLWKDLSDVLKKTLQDMTLKQLMERKNKRDMGGNGWVEYII